jgi:NAD(P)H-flavin reductase
VNRGDRAVEVQSGHRSSIVLDENVSRAHWVHACGPEGMVNQAWDAAMEQKKGGQKIDFHHEVFAW